MRPGLRNKPGNSFTLLEMLGVMAVMAILAGVAVPPMLRTLQNVQTVNEDKNLEEIARALTEAIKAEGQIPNPFVDAVNNNAGIKGWVALAAPYSSMPADSIRYVYPDRPQQTERRLYILSLANGVARLDQPFSYTVPNVGWSDAAGSWQGIRTSFIVLISSSKPDYLLACPPNNGLAAYQSWAASAGPAAVSWAKDWVKQAVNGVYVADNLSIVGSVQDASSLTWTNKGQFLHVKVIPVSKLLSEIVFTDPPSDGGFTIGPTSEKDYEFTTADPVTVYAIQGSRVYTENASGSRSASGKAVSGYLNFTYSTGGGGAWSVTP